MPTDIFRQRFGAAVRDRRILLGLSQTELAQTIADFSGWQPLQSGVSRIESGEQAVTLDQALEIFAALTSAGQCRLTVEHFGSRLIIETWPRLDIVHHRRGAEEHA